MALAGMARQSAAGRAQCRARTAGRGRQPNAGVGRAACHRRGIARQAGLHLLGRGIHGRTGALQLRHQHQQHLGAQPAGHQSAKPHAAADARPHTALRLARQGAHAQRRHHQPSGGRREQRGELPHRNSARHTLYGDTLSRSLLLPLQHGPPAGAYHRCAHPHLHLLQPHLLRTHANAHPAGARLRLEGAERTAGNGAEPHAHQDARKRHRHGR